MSYVIKEATSSREMEYALAVRYDALVEQDRKVNRLFRQSKKVSNHYDVFPNTINVVALQHGKAVANIRAIHYQQNDDGINSLYDFSESVKNVKGTVYLIDMVVFLKEVAGNSLLMESLLRSLLISIFNRKGKYVFLLASPPLWDILPKFSFYEIGEQIFSDIFNSEVKPMAVDIEKFYDEYLSLFKDREILRFQETFYRVIFEPGEVIIREGEKGTSAFIVESGEVEVIKLTEDSYVSIVRLGTGSLLGEMGLVTNDERTASIIAVSPCSCVAFDRSNFLSVMYKHPTRMHDMFQIIARRLTDTTKALAKLQSSKG